MPNFYALSSLHKTQWGIRCLAIQVIGLLYNICHIRPVVLLQLTNIVCLDLYPEYVNWVTYDNYNQNFPSDRHYTEFKLFFFLAVLNRCVGLLLRHMSVLASQIIGNSGLFVIDAFLSKDQGAVLLQRSDDVSQEFQPTAAQLSMKAALPLAKILATASRRNDTTGPINAESVSMSWRHRGWSHSLCGYVAWSTILLYI